MTQGIFHHVRTEHGERCARHFGDIAHVDRFVNQDRFCNEFLNDTLAYFVVQLPDFKELVVTDTLVGIQVVSGWTVPVHVSATTCQKLSLRKKIEESKA